MNLNRTLIACVIIALAAPVFPGTAQEFQWTEKTPMPTARVSAASAILDGDIYVIGGLTKEADSALNVVEVYHPTTDSWDTLAPLPTGLGGAGAQALNGKIYVFGGVSTLGGSQYNSIFSFDPDSNAWEQVGEMPAILPSNWGMAMAAHGEKIYSMGGAIDLSAHAFTMSYDATHGEWENHRLLLPRRWGASAVAIDDKVYVMGGTNYPNTYNDIQAYDPVENSWEELAPMPEARLFHGSVFYNGKIYVMPGAKSNPVSGVIADSMFTYDIAEDVWQTHYNPIPGKLSGYSLHTAVDENGTECIYVIGGATLAWWDDSEDDEVTNAVWKFEEMTVGTEDISRIDLVTFNVSPNPASDIVQVRFHLPASASIRLSIHDFSGKLLLLARDVNGTPGDNLFEFNIHDLTPDIYLCKMQWRDQIITRKLMKAH